MSEIIKNNHTELFTDLSVLEQESVSGGFTLFLQKTDITTFAINELSVKNSSGDEINSRQKTGYKYSQFIIGFSTDPFLGNESHSIQSNSKLNLSNFLINLFLS